MSSKAKKQTKRPTRVETPSPHASYEKWLQDVTNAFNSYPETVKPSDKLQGILGLYVRASLVAQSNYVDYAIDKAVKALDLL